MSVDLTEQTLTAGGTADPARHIYRLLPDVLAARIEKLPPYEYCGRQVSFRRVATADGAELMSWPPTSHIPVKNRRAARPVAFLRNHQDHGAAPCPSPPSPRIHLTTGIRRWVRGQVWPADGDAATVYLHTEGPWLAGAGESARFASAPLTVRRYGGRREGRLGRWRPGGHHVPAEHRPRLPEARRPRAGRGGMAHRQGRSSRRCHPPCGDGIPRSRHRVHAERAAAAHASGRPRRWHRTSTPVADLATDRRVKASPEALLKPHVTVPSEEGTPEVAAEDRREDMTKNAEIDAANARLRREHLARAAGGDHMLCCHLLYQTEPVRDALIGAAEQSLDLAGYRVVAPEGTWSWQTPELEVRIHARELGVHGGPLGAGIPPRRGGQTQQAIEDRRRNVRDFLAGFPEDSRVVFVELDGKKAFRRRTTDPKFAIRLGCADAGRVSQFITPERQAGEGQEGRRAGRR